ncbi:tetraacyldisaccharide 4'-kinase [Paraflavisolibacter sp. H34]|uniref:tetraacyldisaccharide 4'-kinase n=1 Tax=Huijunlia imazamoxiresistens TaxID=3127457 RepID=UPI00301967E3
MFSNPFLKSFRLLLFPFAFLYGLIVSLRNWLYDKGIKKSAAFGLPVVCVGNLSVGGTGKSPMVEYLVRLLQDHYRVATLSRGYKRKTRGYALASEKTTALDIGDEPLQFHRKFPDIAVAVGEERLVAIPQLLHDRPETEVILLDDAFQHRAIRAGLNILLTDYGNLFTRDFYLPAGDLRDARSSYQRAQVIVVTKCPHSLTAEERDALQAEIEPLAHQKLFFSTLSYGLVYHLVHRSALVLDDQTEVLLVTGIANPKPLEAFLEERIHTYHLQHFSDHHIFTIDDLRDIKKKFDALQAPRKIILTTEKDATRLEKFENEINGIPFYVIPIEPRFLFDQGSEFDAIILSFIEQFKKPV